MENANSVKPIPAIVQSLRDSRREHFLPLSVLLRFLLLSHPLSLQKGKCYLHSDQPYSGKMYYWLFSRLIFSFVSYCVVKTLKLLHNQWGNSEVIGIEWLVSQKFWLLIVAWVHLNDFMLDYGNFQISIGQIRLKSFLKLLRLITFTCIFSFRNILSEFYFN